MKWVFVFPCAAFICTGQPAKPGDGAYYETQKVCESAAKNYARRHRIKLGIYEPACVERAEPKP
jgi:hypothetical protein